MEVNETPVVDPSSDQSSPRKNFLQRLMGILIEPAETLQEIATRPTWLFPLILSLCLISIPTVMQTERIPREARVKAIAEQAAQFGQDAKVVEKALLAREESAWTKYQSVPWLFIGGILITLLIAAIFLGAFLATGCSLSFKNSMAAYCWASLPPTLVMALLAILFLFIKDPSDLNPLDPMGNIISHLGILIEKKAHAGLYSFLSSMDFFSFWRIYLLGLGYSLATYEKTSLKKSITVVIVLWLIYVLGKTGIAMIWS
jgi:hypothetical protein